MGQPSDHPERGTPREEAKTIDPSMRDKGFDVIALVLSHPVRLEEEISDEVGYKQRQ